MNYEGIAILKFLNEMKKIWKNICVTHLFLVIPMCKVYVER